MRTASVILLLLAAHAAVLFIAPAGAVRTLSDDTSSTTPTEPAAVAAADPSAALPASSDMSVAIEIIIAGGNCAAAKHRVRNTMNMIMSRILTPIADEIDDIDLDSARCSTSRGNARVVIKYDLEVDNKKVVDDIMEDWISKMVNVDAWANSFWEMAHLVQWVNSKGWKVADMKMQVDD